MSVGICADPGFHPYEEINELDNWIDWLRRHEPQLGAAIDGRRDDILDFLKIRRFSFGTQRLYSPQRWCLIGDASMFSDALYSPGSDFIGMGHSFLPHIVGPHLQGPDRAPAV